jgi:hypothetical protein
MSIDIKRAVQPGAHCYFKFFRDGQLFYTTEAGEIFPVPVEDAGSATFNNIERGMYLMRWMRKFNQGSGVEE